MKKGGQTAHNRIVYAAGAKAPLASVRLGRLRLPRLTPAHFCGCWNASRSFIATAKTSYTTETLYAIWTEFIEKMTKKLLNVLTK